jgi:predicted Rossmann fold nucleotide-binding protein DprA/Smf involved in DNA uptake
MTTKKYQEKTYRQLQNFNSKNRNELNKENQTWLKVNKYKNIGWNKVVELFDKIEELQDKEKIQDWSLEELFLESDRIGNKYLSNQEINDFNCNLAKKVQKISDIVDIQFPPDETIEIINYENQNNYKFRK